MNSFKLLVVFIVLLFGSFAQRFQRLSFDGTQNGYINGTAEMDNLDALSSDGENYVQYGNDVKFVGDSGKVGLELTNDELRFQLCSDGCMGKTVFVCYDCENTDETLRGDCDLNQCELAAGVEKEDEGMASQRQNLLWFITPHFSKRFDDNGKICESIVMKSPEAEVTFPTTSAITSRDPKKYDGKVIKLSVSGVKPGCPLYVLNAKKWTPPLTTLPTTLNSTTPISQTTAKSSNGEKTLWILIGIGIFILLIVVIGFGYCCYRTQIQKKPLCGKKKDVQQKAFSPEASKKAEVVKEKTADEKEVVAKPESTKEATKEESTVAKEKQPKPTKKKAPKEKEVPIVEAKPSKEISKENGTNEDAPPAMKFSVEPTLQDPTTDVSVVQKSVIQQKQPGNPPRIFVPKKVILPAMNSDGFKSVSLLDTLSGKEDYETQHSTHASEKPRKNKSTGRKKGSKKHR